MLGGRFERSDRPDSACIHRAQQSTPFEEETTIMSNHNIIRAWKDRAYRNRLTAAELAAMPANPAGTVEISDEDLGNIAGGRPASTISVYLCTLFECTNMCSLGCPTAFCSIMGEC
jgi:mersacidin/lichenicidin family type 2 lantibiotic